MLTLTIIYNKAARLKVLCDKTDIDVPSVPKAMIIWRDQIVNKDLVVSAKIFNGVHVEHIIV